MAFMRRIWLLTASVLTAADWPAWRGADGSGVFNGTGVPVSWSKTSNVKWRVDLPEPGNSTPIAVGNRIFLTQPKKGGYRMLICLDKATGKQLWEATTKYMSDDPTHSTNPHASASPVSDGERVIAWFGSAGLTAWDLNGKELWSRDLGKQRHTWGYASSPVIHGDRVFLHFGPGDRAFLIALDKRDGKTLWQVDVPAGEGIKFNKWDPRDMYGSWSTPLIADGQLIVTHPKLLRAYNPADGKALWSSEGMGDLVYPSPLAARTAKGDPVIVAPSGFQGPSMVVKMGGSGDVTQSHRLWHTPKSKNFIGTGVSKDGYLYWVATTGVAECVQLATGEVLWSARLSPDVKDGTAWSSVVMNGDNLYITNKSGQTIVYKANPKALEVVSINPVDEATNSSIVIADGDVILRTHSAVWCFSAMK